MVPEGRGVFAKLTVTENLEMGAYHRNDALGSRPTFTRMFELFPPLEGAPQTGRRHAVRRRTADAGMARALWPARACCC